MRYVLLGNLDDDWISKQKQRTTRARAKLKKLGISIESVNYTQGTYDFVDIVEAPRPEAVLAFSVWYAGQGFGKITTLPAFDEKTFTAALKLA